MLDERAGRAADLVLFGPEEILYLEIERLLIDLQAQYRAARIKHELLSGGHRRPVRLVLVVDDTRRNRRALLPHAMVLSRELPAASREILRVIRTGETLARDGLLWMRRPGRRERATPAGAERRMERLMEG